MSEITEPQSTEPEKLDLASLDIAAEKRAELLRLFPETRTEGGKIDFDRLRLALGETVDVGKERYGMNWPGKADCFKAIQRPSLGTLRPVREESVNFDETENLIIEGDNLEVLKLLQKAYQGKVKMIYIDPPYNTGNDFIYPDNYSENLQTYLEYTRQVDSEGRKFSNNTETDGRFHSKWLNMMYTRLFLANNLLSDDGVIFVSIDDREVVNLRLLMAEVFGMDEYIAQIALVNNLKGRNDKKHIATAHEYIVAFGKALFDSNGLPLSERQRAEYRQLADDGAAFQWRDLRKRGGADTRTARPKLFFPIYANENSGQVSLQSGGGYAIEIFPKKSDGTDGCWRWGNSKVKQSLSELRAAKVEGKERWNVSYRVYLESEGEARTSKPKSVWSGPEFSTDAATKMLASIFPEGIGITPKPVELIKQLCRIAMDEGDICLDFFAGTGTTAQSLLELNREDGGDRKVILVQLPEPTEREDFKTIADITKERVRRVIQRHAQEAEGRLNLGNQPKEGFRVLKLATSNFNVWNANTETIAPEALAQQLTLQIDHIQAGRTSEDLLYEILLKSGFPPTTPIEVLMIEGKTVYSVIGYGMLICLESGLTHELIRAIAERKPSHVVCLDEGFAGNDQLKTNAVLIMRSKGVTKFQTI